MDQQPDQQQGQRPKRDRNQEEAQRWGHARTRESAEEDEGYFAGVMASLGCIGFMALPITVLLIAFLFIVAMGLFRGCSG